MSPPANCVRPTWKRALVDACAGRCAGVHMPRRVARCDDLCQYDLLVGIAKGPVRAAVGTEVPRPGKRTQRKRGLEEQTVDASCRIVDICRQLDPRLAVR